MPGSLRNSLDRLLLGTPRAPLGRLLAAGEQLRSLQRWVEDGLSRTHLVKVANALSDRFDAELPELGELGVPTDLLACFPHWRAGQRRGFRPPSLGLRGRAEGAGHALGGVRVQLSPHGPSIPYSLALLNALLRATDPATRVVLVIEPDAHLEGVHSIVAEATGRNFPRVTFARLPTATVWARDNARLTETMDGEPCLLLPRGAPRLETRAHDHMDVGDAQEQLGVRVVRSHLYWEGGNLLHDGQLLLIGVDTVVENTARLGLTQREVLRCFEAELGSRAIMLGDADEARFEADGGLTSSGQAEGHLDYDVSLLGLYGRKRRPRALLADPARGLELVPASMARRTAFAGHFLPPARVRELVEAEYYAYALERHPRLVGYAEQLEAAGQVVIGMPDLRVAPANDLFARSQLSFAFCNVVPALHRGKPAVYYLGSGIRAFDDAAAARLRNAGLRPVPVTARSELTTALGRLRGGLRCFSGPLC